MKLEQIVNDFRYFASALFQIHKIGSQDEIDLDICSHLQDGPNRSIILASRGRGKTTLVVAHALFELLRQPDQKMMFISASQSHAKKMMYLARKWIITTPFLQQLTPKKGQRDASEYMDVGTSRPSKDPSIVAYGISGQITGSRAHRIYGDDVETPESALTADLRSRMRERIREFESIIFPGGYINFVGTPHHEETVYVDLSESGYTVRSWPGVYPREYDNVLGLAPKLSTRLHRDPGLHGQPTSPDRFSVDDLAGRELSMGRSAFSMQFRLLIGLDDEDRHPLKLRDLIVMPVHHSKAPATLAWGMKDGSGSTRVEDIQQIGFGIDGLYGPIMVDSIWQDYQCVRAYIDPSGGTGQDETAWAIGGQLNGYLYLLKVGSYSGGHTLANTQSMIDDLKRYQVQEATIETNYGGEMLMRLIEPQLKAAFEDESPGYPNGWQCRLVGSHSTGQKEVRIIDALEPIMNQHRLVVHPDAVKDTSKDMSLQWQMTRLTRERGCLKHDDKIDAVAGWAGLFGDMVRQDARSQREQHIQAAQEDRLMRHKELSRMYGSKAYFFVRA